MKLKVIFLALTFLASPMVSAQFNLVPNEFRNSFKSTGKLPEQSLTLSKSLAAKARLNPKDRRPILLYEFPESTKHGEVAQALEQMLGDKNMTLVALPAVRQNFWEYSLLFKGKVVEGAWLKLAYDNENHLSTALQLPLFHEKAIEFDTPQVGRLGYKFQDGRIVETASVALGADTTKVVSAMSKTSYTVRSVVATEDTGAKLIGVTTDSESAFYDIIMPDSEGHMWVTRPFNDEIIRIDPLTFAKEVIQVGKLPDGLFVDSKDRIWIGVYGAESLGMYDSKNKSYREFKIDYPESAPAIPFVTRLGDVWFTDHKNNRIVRFDESTSQMQSVPAKSKSVWPVEMEQVENDERIYVTQCYGQSLGRYDTVSKIYEDIPLETSGTPCFAVPMGQVLWVSTWTGNGMIKYDTVTGAITHFTFTYPDKQIMASGYGPIHKMPDGDIVIGSLSGGFLVRFNPTTETATYVKGIDTLKDGMSVSSDGGVWPSGTNKLQKVYFSK